ncbi:hypothetical protein PHJA_002952100 [Phtheirospermum japonicum]|uniref:Uncharacterized protein n=1 Tax=Phtheirospermum japonicum TaxID=374723 RepID=A0A830D7L6_9LAMI|nr:hypothetical protein PHJA_002952100 [Phtheirospermum japonicum]
MSCREASQSTAKKWIYLTWNELAEFALIVYNDRHGTDLEFVSFCTPVISLALVMVLTLVIVTDNGGISTLRLGGDDDKYVLATLSVAEPSDVWCGGKWKKEYLGRECCVCPDDIRHPWHGFRYGFNCPPIQMAPNLRAMAKGMECNGILQG